MRNGVVGPCKIKALTDSARYRLQRQISYARDENKFESPGLEDRGAKGKFNSKLLLFLVSRCLVSMVLRVEVSIFVTVRL